MLMKLKVVKEKFEFLNPMKGMEKDTQIVEYREDPLTGLTCIYNPATAEKARIFFGSTDRKALKEFAEQTKESCFFCPEKLETSATRFLEFENLKKGEAVLFPNLYAVFHDSAVIVLTKKHFLDLNEFTPEIFENGISLGLTYLRRRYEQKKIKYGVLGGNYLPPAGASIVHPHMHVLSSKTPFRVLKVMIKNSEKYYRKKGVNIVDDILKAKERYIGKFGSIEAYVPFAPLGNNEIDGVIRKRSLLDLNEKEIKDISSLLAEVLKFYYKEGISSYNFMIYSGALNGKDNLYCGIKIISRQNFKPFYTNDVWYLLKILQESLIFESPEQTAEKFREAIKRKR
jgi:galactose-1-phosphate uridylyltransferase